MDSDRDRGVMTLGLVPKAEQEALAKGLRTVGALGDWLATHSLQECQDALGFASAGVLRQELRKRGYPISVDATASVSDLADGECSTEDGPDWSVWKTGSFVRIVRPTSNAVTRSVVLGEGIELLIHYDDANRRCVPCVSGCWLCPRPKRPKKYFPVGHVIEKGESPQSWFPLAGILEVSGAWIETIGWRRGLETTCIARGRKWEFAARGMANPENLPPPFNVLAYLERIFGMPIQEEEGERPDTINFEQHRRKQA